MVNPDILDSLSVVGITEGRAFISAEYFENVDKDTNTTRNVILENPVDSGVFAAISAPRVIPTGSVVVQGYKNVTIDTAGTAMTTVNSRTDGTDDPVVDLSYDVEFSGGTSFPRQEFPSGSAGTFGASGGTESVDNAILVGPGDNFLTQIENISPITINCTLEYTFSETLEKNIPSAWSP